MISSFRQSTPWSRYWTHTEPGVANTYIYELLDANPDPTNSYNENDYGLFNTDGIPKLTATAIHNLTTILTDPNPEVVFSPGSLTYAADLPANGNQLLLEKSTGTFDLLLWAESVLWSPSAQSEIAAPLETGTVEFGQVEPIVLVFDPLQGTTPVAAYMNVQSVQVALAGDPLIVEIPSTDPTLSSTTITGFSLGSGPSANGNLNGTAAANSTVLVFDNTIEIGAATANVGGAWSFTTGTLAEGTNSFSGITVDGAGDVSAISAAFTITIDSPAPIAPLAAPVIVGYSITNTNQAVLAGIAEANCTISIFEGEALVGTTTSNATGIWSFTTSSIPSSANTFSARETDASGDTSASSNSIEPTVTWPVVLSVKSSGSGINNGNGNVSVGSVVTLTLTMSAAVTVSGGTPTLSLNDGGTATYTGGSGSDALTFSNTVGAGQNTTDLAVTAVNLGTASVTDVAGNGAVFLNVMTNFVGSVDVEPGVLSVAISGTNIINGNGDLNAGHVVTLTLNMSEAVTVNTTGGTPTLTLNDGGTATYTGGSGSSALTFSYTVAAGQNTPDLTVSAVNLNGATIADAAGNNASLSGTFNPTGTLQIDTTTPTVTSVAASGTGISNGSGDLNAGHVVTLTLTMSEAVTVTHRRHADADPQRRRDRDLYRRLRQQRADFQLHGGGRTKHARPGGDGRQSQRRYHRRCRRQQCQPLRNFQSDRHTADRHHSPGATGNFDRRPQCEQLDHAHWHCCGEQHA